MLIFVKEMEGVEGELCFNPSTKMRRVLEEKAVLPLFVDDVVTEVPQLMSSEEKASHQHGRPDSDRFTRMMFVEILKLVVREES